MIVMGGAASRGGRWGWRTRRALGAVVADRVHPDHLAVVGQLHRPGDDRDLDRLPGPGSPGPVGGAGEADRTRCRRRSGSPSARRWRPRGPALHRQPRPATRSAWSGLAPLRVGGDQHPGVQDLHQPVGDDDLDRLTGERRTRPGSRTRPARSARAGRPSGSPPAAATPLGRLAVGRQDRLVDVDQACACRPGANRSTGGRTAAATGAAARCCTRPPTRPAPPAARAMRRVLAVVRGEELGAHRLVQPLHLPGRGRRVRRGQQVPDPVLGADPVEQHRPPARARTGR